MDPIINDPNAMIAAAYAKLSPAIQAAYDEVKQTLTAAKIWSAARNELGVMQSLESGQHTAPQIIRLYLTFCARYGNDPDAGLRSAHGDGAMLCRNLLRYGVELVPSKHAKSDPLPPIDSPPVHPVDPIPSRGATTDPSTVLSYALLPFALDHTGNATAEDTVEGRQEMSNRRDFLASNLLSGKFSDVASATLVTLCLTGAYHTTTMGESNGVDPNDYAGKTFEQFVATFTGQTGAPGDATETIPVGPSGGGAPGDGTTK